MKKQRKKKKKQNKALAKINQRERERLGGSGIVRTRFFKHGQTIGKANEGKTYSPEEIAEYEKNLGKK